MNTCPNCNFVIKERMPWMTEARKHLGQKEVPGLGSNQWILSLWDSIPWIWSTVSRVDDSVLPWCGAFIRFCLMSSNIKPPKHWYRARAYIDFGTKLDRPAVGAIAVIKKGSQYHVGFVSGKNNNGDILLIGGNQSDSVKNSAFKKGSVVYYGWPTRDLTEINYFLPTLNARLDESIV